MNRISRAYVAIEMAQESLEEIPSDRPFEHTVDMQDARREAINHLLDAIRHLVDLK